MSWANPTALAGLLLLAVPILVHLYGRRRPRRERFPSLRLLPAASANPAAVRRPSDVLLLLLRCGIVGLAALALAQPRWPRPAASAAELRPTRAIVVDTGASLLRLTSTGRPAVAAARAIARALSDSSREALVVESVRPGRELAGVGHWLASRDGAREVVIVSDFQVGAVSAGDLAAIPTAVGVRTVRLAVTGPATVVRWPAGMTVTAESLATEARWPNTPGDSTMVPRLAAAPGDSGALLAARDAARATAGAGGPDGDRTLIVFPGAPGRDTLLAGVDPLAGAASADFVISLARDPVLADLVRNAEPAPCGAAGTPVALNAAAVPVAAVVGRRRASGEIVIAACVPPGSLAGAALVARVTRLTSSLPDGSELEPRHVPDDERRGWERASAASPVAAGSQPIGRWLWVLALVLLGVEWWWRGRRRPGEPVAGGRREAGDRAA